MPRDLYTILGISRDASKEDIKRAYRKLSKELHPDRNKGNKEKEQRFKEVNEAYEVLTDDKKRAAYDQFGTVGGAGGSAGNSGPFGGFDFSGFTSGDLGGFGDIFETFFGGQSGGRRKRSERGEDREVEITIDLKDVVTGVTHALPLDREGVCGHCYGTGAEEGAKTIDCRECGGTGQITKTAQSFFGSFRQTVVCPTCSGAGKMPERVCRTCGGEGRVKERKSVTVHIPAGVQDGQALRVRGEGGAGFRGGTSGDLYVHVRVRPSERFERDGDDIRTQTTLPVLDVLLGAEGTVETVHGSVTLKVPAGTQPGQVFRLKGKGLPVLGSSRMGDHYVTVHVEIPTRLSRAEQKIVEEWKKLQD